MPRPAAPGEVIPIASDHGGFELKELVREHLAALGCEPLDLGCFDRSSVDYPDFAFKVTAALSGGDHHRGILICGTGIGMAIVANKVPGVRAAQVHDIYTAERARKSNDAQIMTMGSQVIGPGSAKLLVDVWLGCEFAGGRSAPKVERIKAIDERFRRKE